MRGGLSVLNSILPNSHFGKQLGVRDMIIFGSHGGPLILNIGYIKTYIYGDILGYIQIYTDILGL